MEKIEGAIPLQTPSRKMVNTVYLKALPIRDISDVNTVKVELEMGNIIIARITPLAKKSVEDTRRAVDELCEFVKKLGGDIARLGEERLVITPPSIKIWRKSAEITG